MSERKINKQHQATFDGIRHVDDAGNEYWLARQLSKVLEYSQYRHFVPVLDRAREAGRNSGQRMEDHMEDILTMVDIGSGAQREVDDVRLSRYACEKGPNRTHEWKDTELNAAVLKNLKSVVMPYKSETRQLELLQRLPGIIFGKDTTVVQQLYNR